MKDFFAALTRHPLSLAGATVVTASAALFLALLALELFGHQGSPYIGILAFVVLPGLFVLGLLMIPVGVVRARRSARLAEERGEAPPGFPVIDLNVAATRRRVVVFLLLTVVNVVILGTAGYKGVEFMDSTSFCGETCHSVMQPEYTAYQRSPHARVNCVACHIGPGAGWFVKSKLSGSWQLVSVTFDLYPRPIPTPVHNLRPARETCEQCHWPDKFVGDRLSVRTHYEEDEANTELKTVLLLRVGGVQGRDSHGIHWHVDPDVTVRYRSDESREQIHEVELTRSDGTLTTYRSGDPPPEGPVAEWRVMDCVDCHNRPSHIYRLPRNEVDAAIREGLISRDLPYVRREAIRLLEQEYASHDAARAEIAAALAVFYRENYPDLTVAAAEQVAAAGAALGDIYCWNVFPSMNVGWGAYPNHIGHESSPGCFRCHDDMHDAEEGETISQDCDTCHTLLAVEEEDPAIIAEINP